MDTKRRLQWSNDMQYHLDIHRYIYAAVHLELASRHEFSDDTIRMLQDVQQRVLVTLSQRTQYPLPRKFIEELSEPPHEQSRRDIQWILGIRPTLIEFAKENKQQIEERANRKSQRDAIIASFKGEATMLLRNLTGIRRDSGVQGDGRSRKTSRTPHLQARLFRSRNALVNIKRGQQELRHNLAALDQEVNRAIERLNEPPNFLPPIVDHSNRMVQPEVTQPFDKAMHLLDLKLSALFAESQNQFCVILQKIMTFLVAFETSIPPEQTTRHGLLQVVDDHYESQFNLWPHAL